ncbi:DUF943 family protein [Trabulsiella odontotermitis]|uniref:DUF943 family protein n=1 Tax=Trabulsiella odontotermitis TaxID=379893 RepID=UPI003AC64576
MRNAQSMIINRKNKYLLFFVVLLCALLVWTMRPVRVVYVSKLYYGHRDIVVDHFPLTDQGKIKWFMKHKDSLYKKYNIDPSFLSGIVIWDVGRGFVAADEDGDLYCFDDMKASARCIDKNVFLRINYVKGEIQSFEMESGEVRYEVTTEGNIEESIK